MDYEDELHEEARRRTGFDDFGDTSYRAGLRTLLEACENDLQLSEAARQGVCGGIVNCLSARLHAQRGWAEHPEVLANAIRRPLVIVGLPRTGTTALHKMLAVDSQFQGIESWLTGTPMIRPSPEAREAHPAYRACVADLENWYTAAPEMRKIHEVVAGEVDECTALLSQSFVSSIWAHAVPLPTYESWLRTQSAAECYHRYADVLRLIGAHEPEKRWLLKSPYHMPEMAALLEVFPDACVIHTHRDPLEAIPSFCNMLDHMIPPDPESGRPSFSGARVCAYWRDALDRTETECRKAPRQFFHVDQQHFRADPLGVVRSLYEYFDLTLSSDTEERMRRRAAAVGAGGGERRYSADSWGIDAAHIGEMFALYRAQHRYT